MPPNNQQQFQANPQQQPLPQNDDTSRLKIYAIVVLSIGLLIVVLLLLTGGGEQIKGSVINRGPIIARNIQHPDKTQDGTIRFFTGSAFAEYNPANNKVKTLSAEVALPVVSEVVWDFNSAYISTNNLAPGYDYYSKVPSGIDAKDELWWKVDFDDALNPRLVKGTGSPNDIEKLSLLEDGDRTRLFIVEKLANKQVLAEVKNTGIQTLAEFSDSSVIQPQSVMNNGVLVKENLDILYIEEGSAPQATGVSSLVSSTKNYNRETAVLIRSDFDPSGSDSHAGEEADNDLVSYSATNNTTQTILEGFNGVFSIDNGLVVALDQVTQNEIASSQISIVDLSSGEESFYVIDSDVVENITPSHIIPLSISLNGQFNAVAIDNGGDLVRLSSNPEIVTRHPGSPFVLFGDRFIKLSNKATADYDGVDNKISIFLSDTKRSTLESTYSQLKREFSKKNFDINWIEKEWIYRVPVRSSPDDLGA